jgi:hypothetical protein
LTEKEVKQEISDVHKLTNTQVNDVFNQSEEIGFIDTETVDGDKLVFNGNLFKTDTIKKAKRVLDSLNAI